MTRRRRRPMQCLVCGGMNARPADRQRRDIRGSDARVDKILTLAAEVSGPLRCKPGEVPEQTIECPDCPEPGDTVRCYRQILIPVILDRHSNRRWLRN